MRNQHIFPKESIKRFADIKGNVIVNTPRNSYIKKATNRTLFTVNSHWEVDSERYQSSVEEPFQKLVDHLINNKEYKLLDIDHVIISNFYALWWARSFVMKIKPSPIRLLPSYITSVNNPLWPYCAYDAEKSTYPMNIEEGVLSSQNRVSFSLHASYKNASESLKSAKWQIISAEPNNLFAIPKDANIKVAYIPLTPELALHGNEELNTGEELAYSIKLSQLARKTTEFITKP